MTPSISLSRAVVLVIKAVVDFFEVEGEARSPSAIVTTVVSRDTLQLTLRTHRRTVVQFAAVRIRRMNAALCAIWLVKFETPRRKVRTRR